MRFLPTDIWVRRVLVPVVAFIAMVTDRGYLADFWHHLARGRAMVQEGDLVDRDLFTYTVPGQTFQDVNWLSQLCYYGLYQLGGLSLVQVVNSLVLAATFALLVATCRRKSGSLFWASLVGAGAFLGCWHVLTIRPQSFSLFLFVLLLDLLEQALRRPYLLIIPPMLVALWTNLHGAFPAGLMLIGCFLLAEVWRAWREGTLFGDRAVWRMGTCLGVSTLATLVNPYGWGIYLYVRQTSSRSAARRIDEWVPPTLDMMIGQALVISLAIGAVLLVLAWRKGLRPAPRDWFLCACFLPLACSSARMVPWWLLVLAPLMTSWLAFLWPQPETSEAVQPSWGAGLTFAALMVAAVFSMPGLQELNPLLHIRMHPRVEDDLEDLHVRLKTRFPKGGRIFARLEWSEYLGWTGSPAFQVFMDGRIEIIPDDVWQQYADVTTGRGDWEKILDGYKVDALILDNEFHNRTGLLDQVEKSPRWRKDANAREAVLFVRNEERAK